MAGIKPNYLNVPINHCDPDASDPYVMHHYETAHFVEFMIKGKPGQFKEFWDFLVETLAHAPKK